jgi:hypothetical protein
MVAATSCGVSSLRGGRSSNCHVCPVRLASLVWEVNDEVFTVIPKPVLDHDVGPADVHGVDPDATGDPVLDAVAGQIDNVIAVAGVDHIWTCPAQAKFVPAIASDQEIATLTVNEEIVLTVADQPVISGLTGQPVAARATS